MPGDDVNDDAGTGAAPGEGDARPLSPGTKVLLLRLADPEAPLSESADATATADVIEAADRHGVLPIVWRKLKSTGLSENSATAQAVRAVDGKMIAQAGQSMLLAHHANKIVKRLSDDGIAAAVIKGPIFAARLYPNRADRPFTDIDVLAAVDDLPRANAAIAGSGFTLARKAVWDHSDKYQEYKFLHDDNRTVMVELHGNLVHYPGLRRRISFGYDALLIAGQSDCQSPPALLVVAVVHAVCGHKFHRLQFAVDILQAVRALSPDDEQRFVAATHALGMTLEAAMALDLTGRLFDEERAIALAETVAHQSRLPRRVSLSLAKTLVTPDAVLAASTPGSLSSRLRRHAFRRLQLIAAARA